MICPNYTLVSGRAGRRPYIPWLQGLLLPVSIEIKATVDQTKSLQTGCQSCFYKIPSHNLV